MQSSPLPLAGEGWVRAGAELSTSHAWPYPHHKSPRETPSKQHDRRRKSHVVRIAARRLEGFKFKRQWTLGPYIVDFCCWEARLIVEVDGGQHNAEVDGARTAWLEGNGYRVRFWNHDVLTNMDGVLQTILAALAPVPLPSPLPQAGEGA